MTLMPLLSLSGMGYMSPIFKLDVPLGDYNGPKNNKFCKNGHIFFLVDDRSLVYEPIQKDWVWNFSELYLDIFSWFMLVINRNDIEA